jgi:hypothetical protein
MSAASVLAFKRQQLDEAGPTIQPHANIQTGGSKPWQVLSPGGLNVVPFPGLQADAVRLCAYQVPTGQSGACTGLAIQVVNSTNYVDGAGNAAWHIAKNGAPVPGYETILTQLGSLQQPLGTYILLQENDVIEVWVQGPTYYTSPGVPMPPNGYSIALLTGYVCYGGQGTYVNPSPAGGQPQRGAAPNRYGAHSNNGSQPNSFYPGSSQRRRF